jgi:hypothetical protein
MITSALTRAAVLFAVFVIVHIVISVVFHI